MPTDHRHRLARIRRFDQLVAYLRDEMGWPIDSDDFEDITFEYTPEELGIDAKNAAKIQKIRRLRPLVANQPWGVFFVKFEPKRLPVVALRRILGQVAIKKRTSANSAERKAWAADDLLFVSNYGEGENRSIAFAHFSKPQDGRDLPTLKVLGWDSRDTVLHLDAATRNLTQQLAWPDDVDDADAWRERWRAAFTLRHREVITTSKQLSERLAELARAIRDRIRTTLAIETERGPVTRLMKAFQTALIHDLDEAAFADMYAQTIAYGLLSARITDPARRTADDFAGHMRTNPFLKEMMEIFLQAGGRRGKAGGSGIDFDELGVSEVIELLDDPSTKMEAVVRDFGDRNPKEDPVIHFYEYFLAAYDRTQKVNRGVFYTPRPVVSYIVSSVDQLLRTDFGLEDGLADITTWGEMANRHQTLKIPDGTSRDQAFVQILDPATGTGTFLVEVIDLIHATMVENWKAEGHRETKIHELWNEYVPRHLLPRLHGYELLMAPYAIAHLKISLKLYETGYRFRSEERARVYLTNALEPAASKQLVLDVLPALAHEAAAVNAVKQTQIFTAVIGNPPYAGHSLNNEIQWIVDKVHDYKRDIPELSRPAQGKWLQDDYVKFLRFGEFLVESAGTGILAFITNHSYLDNPTFRGMRRHMLATFSSMEVLDLHGNLKKRESAADGSRDDNVFDIQQGVSVILAVRIGKRPGSTDLSFSELFGSRTDKYSALLATSVRRENSRSLTPSRSFFLFRPEDASLRSEYNGFVSLPTAMAVNGDPAPGVVTTHDDFAISWSSKEMVRKVGELLKSSNEKEARKRFRLCGQAQWNYNRAKRELPSAEWKREVAPILYRPFDLRWTVYNSHVAVHRRMRATQHFLGRSNLGLCVGKAGQVVGGNEWNLVSCTKYPVDFNYFYRGGACNFPLYLHGAEGSLLSSHTPIVNFTDDFLNRLPVSRSGTYLTAADGNGDVSAESAFGFVYAILHSPGYRLRYADFLKIDFPRVPIPSDVTLFDELASLGAKLVGLHLLESSRLNDPSTSFAGPEHPIVGRVGWSDDTVWLDAGQTNARNGHRATTAGTVGFKGVPEAVWDFHIGGYQVCHKWLKDRKRRRLLADDIAHYQKIVVALNETISIMAEIDEVIEKCGGWPDAFHAGAKPAGATVTTAKVIPFRPRTVDPKPDERYVSCAPFVPLKVAAGAFSDPQHVDDDDFEWVAVDSRQRLRKGMFVAQVVGESMEPVISDGSYCLFRAPVEGTRQGKVVLVQLRDATDPETGQRYTVKRYRSEKQTKGDSWRHETIMLEPANPDFDPIVLTGADEDQLQVIAEFVEVLQAPDP
jgi:SOS-response transcriptional repressor LexA